MLSPGQGHGLHGIRQVVDVQHLDALEFRDLVQVEIVGDDLGAELLGQGDQLAVHFADLGEVLFGDPDLHVAHLLDPVQDVEAAPAPGPFQGVRGIGDVLQFVQDELRNDDGAVEKFRLAHIGDPAVDDHARIHDLDVLFRAALEELLDVRGVEPLSLPDADGDTDVAEETVHEQKDEIHDAPLERHELEGGRNDIGRRQAEDKTEDTADDDL